MKTKLTEWLAALVFVVTTVGFACSLHWRGMNEYYSTLETKRVRLAIEREQQLKGYKWLEKQPKNGQ